mgnify:CR=1 FL=1
MAFMVVTLEVSKLSGWLNAFAPCREPKGWHTIRCWVRCGPGGGRRRATAVQKARRGGLAAADCEQGNREERTRNMELMSVTLDVSKLSGWLKADAACRVERRACDVGRGAGWEA